MRSMALEPGQSTIDSCSCRQRPQGGYVLQWRVRPLNGERPAKLTVQGSCSQAELRRRAHAKTEEFLATHGRPRTSLWRSSDGMRDYVLKETIPAIEAKPDSKLRPRTRKKYVELLRLYAEAARRYPIADAATSDALEEALLSIERGHGTATAKQVQKVVRKYVVAELKSDHVISVNEAIGLNPDYTGDQRKGSKPKGGQALTRDQRLRVVDHLLSVDPTMPRGARGRYTAEERTAKRLLVIDATLTQATCGLRIVEIRRLTRSCVAEANGMLLLEITDEASKTRRGRMCFVDDERVAERIRERVRRLPADGDPYVFGAPAAPGAMWDSSNAQKAVRALYDELAGDLGIPLLRNVASHVWRATLNSEWRDRGVPAEVRSAYFGHSVEVNRQYYTADIDLSVLAGMVRPEPAQAPSGRPAS